MEENRNETEPNGTEPTGTERDGFKPNGTELAGMMLNDYRIERRIGSGAMADVWLARQCSLDRPVALKILRRELARDETYVRRFIQEAQSAAKLEHPNIVHIYEIGSVRDPVRAGRGPLRRVRDALTGLVVRFARGRRREEPYHYIAEEYVSGLNLQQYLRLHGPLSVEQTFYVMLQIASALEKAADMEIVHRDIKPENILLGNDGSVKIADFGLAQCERSDVSLTQFGVTLGTPLYMSPEQSQGKEIDFRSDIYSFGVTAWQILAGRTPFTGDTPLSVVLEHLHTPVPSLDRYRSDVPADLSAILYRMLDKKPENRYASFFELIEALRDAQRAYMAGPHETPSGNGTESAPDGAAAFRDGMNTAAVSMRLQTSFLDLKVARSNERRIFSWPRLAGLVCAMILAFTVGALACYWLKTEDSMILLAPPKEIERFETVEEQWVFASQLNTVEAWKSVATYFPDQDYWRCRARQQLARLYVLDNAIAHAKPIFFEFSEMSGADAQYVSFGRAGLAWCLAAEGNIDRASILLSELRAGKTVSFGPLTEELISRAQDMIRNKT